MAGHDRRGASDDDDDDVDDDAHVGKVRLAMHSDVAEVRMDVAAIRAKRASLLGNQEDGARGRSKAGRDPRRRATGDGGMGREASAREVSWMRREDAR